MSEEEDVVKNKDTPQVNILNNVEEKEEGEKLSVIHTSSIPDDPSPLYLAVRNNKHLLAKKLLEEGADTEQPNNEGVTLLHLAISLNNAYIVWQLILHGADTNATTYNEGDTPLHFAAGNGNFAIINMLLRTGAHPYRTNYSNQTFLHKSIMLNHTGVVINVLDAHHKFLEYQFDVPLLHTAVKSRSTEMVQIFLDEKMDIFVKDKHQRTVFFYALRGGETEMIEFLKPHFITESTSMSEFIC